MKALPSSLLLGVSALLFVSCRSEPKYGNADVWYYRNQPEKVEEAYAEAFDDKGPDALVGVEKLLSAAILRGDWERADILAQRASLLVNVYMAGETGERDALGLLGQEKDKPFKGEPHEQVMADFYLGLLRYQRRDYEGALAAFRSAMNKDRGTFLMPVDVDEAKEDADNVRVFLFSDDWAILRFFAAKCYQLLGEPDEAEKQLAVARQIAPKIAPLLEEGMDPSNNVLVVVEGGQAPLKQKSGPKGAILAYGRAPVSELRSVSVAGSGLSFSLIDDLYYQATTIGGRQVDVLNEDKAKKQEALQTAGFAVTTAGYILATAGAFAGNRNTGRNLQTAGLIAIGVGILTMIIADAAIDPSADTRAWTTLPGVLFLGVGRAPPGGDATLEVIASGSAGDESQTWTRVPVDETNNLYWIRLLPGRRGGAWNAPHVES